MPALLPHHQTALAAELAKPEFDGMTAQQAFALLTDVPTTTRTESTGFRLTPVSTAQLIGVAKAQALAALLKSLYPDVAADLLDDGVDPTKAETVAFLEGAKALGHITQADIDAITAATVRTVTERGKPQFVLRMARVDFDTPELRAQFPTGVPGFPNSLWRESFDAAWTEAGR